jgi:hypothetical protein
MLCRFLRVDPNPKHGSRRQHKHLFHSHTSSLIPKTGVKSSQFKSIQKQQTTIRKPIECAPEASRGGRESMEMP